MKDDYNLENDYRENDNIENDHIENDHIENDYRENLFIDKCLSASERIDKLVKKIYKTVELTKMNATDEFKPFTEPKKNLDDLSTFYDIFIECDEEYNRIKNKKIEISNIDEALENLKESQSLYNIKEKLGNYEKVVIVKSLLKDNNQLYKNLIGEIENVFFNNLGISKDTKKLSLIIKFLLEKGDSKVLLSRYSSELYNKVSFDKINFDRTALLKSTANIDKYIYDLDLYNTEILGEKYSNMNLGFNKILIINLSKVINENLQVIEKEEKMDYIPFLIELNSNLKHEDIRIKEVETLFVFKDAINKIICNILITFTDNINRLDSPNKYCDVENLALNLKRALDSMNSHKIVTKVFIKNYGPMFKIKTIEECNEKFTMILISKILNLAKMGELKNCIYLINNLYALQNYLSKDLVDKIEECENKIVNTFKNELEKRSKDKLTGFIDSNIAAFKSYYLPDDVRIKVVSLLKKVIWEEIGKKEYTGELDKLNANINDMFIGK